MEIEEKKYYEGIYRKNQKGFGFVKINEQEEEIYISKENSLKAFNEDKVLIEVIDDIEKENSKKEGKIIKIIKHEKDTVVGTFYKNKNFGFVVPDDKNFGTDIFISKSNFGKARNKQKVQVKIIKYPEENLKLKTKENKKKHFKGDKIKRQKTKNRKSAEGKIIEVLGGVNEAGVDMLSLIKEYKLPSVFPEQVVEEAKRYGTKIEENEIKNRIDLRNQTIFTIDGEDAKDLDDAVRVEKLENGNYKLHVHIADVSYYVKENS